MIKLDKSNIEDIFPMSDIQQGMLFHSFKNNSKATYHDQNIFGLTDDGFSFQVFQRALSLMVEKHGILRTVFNLVDYKEPVQIVLKRIPANVVFQSLEHLEDNEAKYDEIKMILDDDRKLAFDLASHEVFWRIKLLKISAEQVCVLWIFHHAILDGWSTTSFMTELHNLYRLLKSDSNHKPSPLRNTYKEYVIEQMIYKKSDEIQNFWTTELADYNRYQLKSQIEVSDLKDVVVFSEELEGTLFNQIKVQSRAYGVSVKAICLAAYVYALKLFSYENDILIGLMGNNRPLCEDSEKILGCFLNATPFRINIASAHTWLELLQLVDEKLNYLAKYDRLSFSEIVRNSNKDASEQNPFFDLTFNFVDFHVYNKLENYKGRDIDFLKDLDFEKTNALLDFEVSTTLDRFQLFITYSVPLLAESKINMIASYFKGVLNKVADSINSEIRNEDLYSTEDVNKLLYMFNSDDGKIDTSTGFVRIFESIVQKYPYSVAVVDDNISLSYSNLNCYANKIGSKLIDLKIQSEEIIILYFNRGAFILASMIAVLKSGAAFVAIDTDTPWERIRYILENCNGRFVLTEENLLERLQTIIGGNVIQPEIIIISSTTHLAGSILVQPEHNLNIRVAGGNLAYIIYTSGSTGTPKGVMLHHLGLSNHLLGVIDFLGVKASDVVAQTASCNFDVCIMQFLLCLTVGGKTIIFNRKIQLEPNQFLRKIKEHRVTLVELVPSHVETLLDNIDSASNTYFDTLRYLISTGEVLSEKLVTKWYLHAQNVPIVNAYGPAETSDDVTLYLVQKHEVNPIPVGRPLKNILVYVIDQNNQLCPLGATGEIAVAGIAVGRGYLHQHELTQASFIENPFMISDNGPEQFNKIFKTGDLGYWNDDGNLIVKGRVGNMVKIRGNRVELSEIESHLDKLPGIIKSIVADKIVNDETVLCAYCMTHQKFDSRKIRKQMLEILPSYMLPSYYVELDEFPTLQNGKIDRGRLPLPVSIRNTAELEINCNLSDKELIILEVWKEVLSLDEIDVNDNYFDVGGHSLNLIKVNSKLNNAFGTLISIVTLFQYPTIRSLAEHLTIDSKHIFLEDENQESIKLMDDAVNFFSED